MDTSYNLETHYLTFRPVHPQSSDIIAAQNFEVPGCTALIPESSLRPRLTA